MNFLACNCPIKQLYNLGVEIEETQNLICLKLSISMPVMRESHVIVKELEAELGAGNKKPEIIAKLAQYELTLKD